MPGEGRATTTLDLKVNARDLSRLDTKLKETLGPQRGREFNRGLTATEQLMRQLVKSAHALTTEMGRQRQQSGFLADMRKEARDARKEIEQLRVELDRLRQGGNGGGGGPGGRGSGGGGPNRGGMRWGVPQVGVPDASSVATAMSAVPVIGMAAAGVTMASYSMYGSALGYQTARRDTFSQLGPQGQAMLGLRMLQGPQAATQSKANGGASAMYAGIRAASQTSGLPEWAINPLYRFSSGFDSYVYDTGASTAMRDAVVGGAAANGYGVTRGHGARSAVWSARMGTGDLEGVGVRYGLKPTEALQEAAGLSSAMGRRSSGDTYDFARAAQTYFGVDQGTTGGLMKGFRTAGGMGSQAAQADAVAQLIGDAVARGLEGSEIAEHLSAMAGFMQKQASMGQEAQLTSGLGIVAERLGRSGFAGTFATDYAMRLGEAGSQMGYGGGSDPVRFAMLQQLGWGRDGQYSGEGYAEAMLKLQDPDSASVAGLGVLSGLSGSLKGSGMGPAQRALLLSRYTGALGAQVGPDAARRMAEGIAGPGAADPTVTASMVRGIHREAGGATVGILAGEAAMESGRISAGYKAAEQVQNLNGVMIDLANTLQDQVGGALDYAIGKLKEFSGAVRGFGGGGSGIGSAGGQ